jgi:hypothetical protein
MASAPTTVPTPRMYELKENGMVSPSVSTRRTLRLRREFLE